MDVRVAILLLACTGCAPAPTTAAPPTAAAPSTLVRGDSGINALAAELCATPCSATAHAAVRDMATPTSGSPYLDLDPASCSVPSFAAEAESCTAMCTVDARGQAVVTSFTIDMGPIGPSTRANLCRTLERDRGVPSRGTCDDVCESSMGCGWPESEDRLALEFIGHLALTCAAP